MFNIDREQLAWAAGFFDGEGHARFDRAQRAPRVSIKQVDRRVLDAFRDAVGVGKVYGPYASERETRAPWYIYQLNSRWAVQHIACVLWPWLGLLKREQIRSALERSLVVPAIHSRRNKAAMTLLRRETA